MSTHLDARRESARAFFESLQRQLVADDILGDKQCVRLLMEKARTEQAIHSSKRFDTEAAFRTRLLYGRIDDALTAWCRKRDIRTDPFNVFRYGGQERGPTQHEGAVGLARAAVERVFDRLAEKVPEIADRRSQVFKQPAKAVAPAFRLQHPLPFGAAAEVKYGGTRVDLERSIYQVAMYAATGGDASRGWRYDCGLLVFYGADRMRMLLGEPLYEIWPDVHQRLWEAGRVWPILL
jgi:hypothetical protein